QIEEGLAVLAEALAMIQGTGTVFHAAELHRLRGEFLLRREPPEIAEAEACFHRALSIARDHQPQSLDLPPPMTLTRRYQRQGRPGEGRALLAETYGWFGEGFDTRDLQEARALLEEVS